MCVYTHIYDLCKEVYYKEVAHVIMKAERSRTRRAEPIDIVSVQVQRHEKQGSQCGFPLGIQVRAED